jgi:hypothetical protein
MKISTNSVSTGIIFSKNKKYSTKKILAVNFTVQMTIFRCFFHLPGSPLWSINFTKYLSFALQDFIANDDNSGSFEPAAGPAFSGGGGHCRHFTIVTKTAENGHSSPSYAALRMEDHSETDREHFFI